MNKSRWIALICGILVLGGGYLYVGRARRFCFSAAAFLSVWLLMFYGGYLSTFVGFITAIFCTITFAIFTLADPIFIAGHTSRYIQKWYMSAPVYIIYFLAMPLIVNELRYSMLPGAASKMGYDIYCATSMAMAPAIMSSDCVLIDTWRYNRKAPQIGEIVIVRTEDGKSRYIRRIQSMSDNSALVAADNMIGVSRDYLNNVDITKFNIEGPATYVLLSDDLDRIGSKIDARSSAKEHIFDF